MTDRRAGTAPVLKGMTTKVLGDCRVACGSSQCPHGDSAHLLMNYEPLFFGSMVQSLVKA